MSRRNFVAASAATAMLPLANRFALASPLGLPLGIQLYSVREQMAHDFDATLAAVRAAGFTEVESASLPKKSAKEIRTALDKAGLRCVSAHHPFGDWHARPDELIAYDKELGVKFVICASPGFRNPPAGANGRPTEHSLDDWKYNAEQFNMLGQKAAAQGVQFGYHNHRHEFAMTEGKTPYLELLRLTDPKLVTFELDCGWVVVGGSKPVDILRDHPHRISMLHVKDFKMPATGLAEGSEPKVTELGQGSIVYKPIFDQAARTQHIQHAFVEQEAFDMPWQESLKVDADYMRALKA